ncbi:MAG TPA: hypothetical protein VMT46_06085 [Anaerolineaceae bacterium]|nr:hypothetical protein [Anaerolineaceae bacterium]
MNKPDPDRKGLWQRPGFLIALILLVFLVLGMFEVTRYGKSWDEQFRIQYAQDSLSAYRGVVHNLTDEKGPFYGMVAFSGALGLSQLVPGWRFIDGWHFMTYLAFIGGVYFFYRLSRRWLDWIPALSTTLLFSTQPVIWGHAFINPKDIPFMAFFLATVCLGLEMVDYFCPRGEAPLMQTRGTDQIAAKWIGASRRLKASAMAIGLGSLGLIILLPLIQNGVASLVSSAYNARSSGAAGWLFSQIARNAATIPASAYIHKAQTQVTFFATLAWFGLLLGLLIVVRKILFPEIRPSLSLTSGWKEMGVQFSGLWFRIRDWAQQGRLNRKTVPGGVYAWLSEVPGNFILLPVGLAGCFFGFSTGIRTLGIASAAMVGIYFFCKSPRKAAPVLLAYLVIGVLVTYLLWPYLWKEPLAHYLTALSKSANFGKKSSFVTFAGMQVSTADMPASYLPTLLSLQFTEPALALICIGVVVGAIYIWKRASLRLDLFLFMAWFAAPFIAAIVLHSSVYNNFRQFLFAIPPLFILGGLAFQILFDFLNALNRKILFGVIVIAALLPGLYWSWQLHPYEYIYYNSLTGGVQRAYRYYDLDYWATSMREDIEYLNRTAPRDATIYLQSNDMIYIAKEYARADFSLISNLPGNEPAPFYTALLSENYNDRTAFPDSEILYSVKREGAVLSVVKLVKPGDSLSGR